MDENARKFDHRIKNLIRKSLLLWQRLMKFEVFSRRPQITPQTITRLRKSVLVTSAGASTRIEGSKLSDEEVRKIMQGLSIQKFADRDSQEVQGYLETLKTYSRTIKFASARRNDYVASQGTFEILK